MKVLITSKGEQMTDSLDPQFGRAKKFILVDTESGAWSAHDNRQNLNAAQGAGIQSAETVIRLGAEAVISGHMGPKAFRVLHEAGLRMYLAPGDCTAQEALALMKQGKIEVMSQPDKEGHWM